MNPTPEVTGGVLRGGRYELRQASMLDLIATAWRVDPGTVLGGPAWLQMDRFDVIATAPINTSHEKVRLMLQYLLADRFKLVLHKEMKPLPVFALVTGNGKLKLKESDGSGDAACQSKREQGTIPNLVVSCRNMSMDEFAQSLRGISAPYINRPIVDRSGVKGEWDFDFKLRRGVPLSRKCPAIAWRFSTLWKNNWVSSWNRKKRLHPRSSSIA
jgi:uncharacterized protein (TIGR03435 family)